MKTELYNHVPYVMVPYQICLNGSDSLLKMTARAKHLNNIASIDETLRYTDKTHWGDSVVLNGDYLFLNDF